MTDWKSLAPVALVFLVAMLVLSFGAMVIQEVRDESSFTSTSAMPNETATATAGGTVTLAYQDLVSTSLLVYNVTNGSITGEDVTLIGSGNYTLEPSTGVVTVSNPTSYDNSLWRFDYDMYVRSTAYMAAANATSGIGKMAKYGPLFALVLVAMLLIGTVVGAYRRR